jgi:hypothetical protein
MTAAGIVTTVAGNGTDDHSGDGGPPLHSIFSDKNVFYAHI